MTRRHCPVQVGSIWKRKDQRPDGRELVKVVAIDPDPSTTPSVVRYAPLVQERAQPMASSYTLNLFLAFFEPLRRATDGVARDA